MGDFNRGGHRDSGRGGHGGSDRRFGGGRDGGFRGNRGGGFRGNRGGGFRNSGPREMHKATCAECGQECEVPFKPTEGREVFCKECFAKKRPPRY